MNGISFCNLSHRINLASESTSVKISYLLSKLPICAGNFSAFLIHYENCKDIKSLEAKVEFLHREFLKVDPAHAANIKDAYATWKNANKIKFKDPKIIGAMKGIEKKLHTEFLVCAEQQIESMNKFGFITLRPLANKFQFGYMESFENKEKINESENVELKNKWKPSDILKYAFQDASEDDEFKVSTSYNTNNKKEDSVANENASHFFMLNHHFYDYFLKNEISIYDTKSDLAFHHENLVLEKLFTLPNISSLSSIELETLRDELVTNIEHWHANLNEWVSNCKNNSSATIEILQTKLLPFQEKIQKIIDQNDSIQLSKKILKRDISIEVYIGMVPLKHFLQYFLEIEMIEQATIDLITEYAGSKNKLNNRVPIFAMNLPVENNENQIDETQIEMSRKKSLDID